MNDAAAVVDRLDAMATRLWNAIESLAANVQGDLESGSLRRTDLRIEGRCRGLIDDPESIVAGAGFVAAPGVLRDAEYWLEWWTSDGLPGTSRRLVAETDPAAVGFRDYTELPWYVAPLASGRRHVTGPYIDYLCTDQHTLTLTMPIEVAGGFGGVVGADVLAARVEREIHDVLDAAGGAVVVNGAGRVVASADPEWIAGDLVRDVRSAVWRTFAVTGLPMQVLIRV